MVVIMQCDMALSPSPVLADATVTLQSRKKLMAQERIIDAAFEGVPAGAINIVQSCDDGNLHAVVDIQCEVETLALCMGNSAPFIIRYQLNVFKARNCFI